MRRLVIVSLAATAALAAAACQRAKENKAQSDQKTSGISGSGAAAGAGSQAQMTPPRPKLEQVAPPFDIKTPPADAVKTPSGLLYKKLLTNDAGAAPQRYDTVLITSTGW